MLTLETDVLNGIHHVGMLFEAGHTLDTLTILDNVFKGFLEGHTDIFKVV